MTKVKLHYPEKKAVFRTSNALYTYVASLFMWFGFEVFINSIHLNIFGLIL